MTTTIVFKIETLYEEINKLSSYLGKTKYTKEGVPIYELIKIKQQDNEFLYKYIVESISNLSNVMREFITGYTLTDDNRIIMVINTSSRVKNTFSKDVRVSSINYICNYCFSKWLNMTYPESAQEYMILSQENAKDLLDKLYYKIPPTRKKH